MPISRLIVFAVSITAGGGAAWLATTRESPTEQMNIAAPAAEPAVEPTERTEVLVATTDLAQRQRIGDGDLEWRNWPEDSLHNGYILRSAQPEAVDEFSGKLVRISMLSGEPIRNEKISDIDTGFLSELLGTGMRAISVRISAESTAGGFILPNDRVDVVQTITPEGKRQAISRTVASNIRVLAIDQRVSAPEENSLAAARTATLELTPNVAEIVSAAEANGTLSLALRSSADNDNDIGDYDQQITLREFDRTIHIISRGEGRFATSDQDSN